jgi:hypothetical protein
MSICTLTKLWASCWERVAAGRVARQVQELWASSWDRALTPERDLANKSLGERVAWEVAGCIASDIEPPVEKRPQYLAIFAANHSGVVGLSAQEDDLPVDRTSVHASLVCGVLNIEVVDDPIFPQSTGFGLSLQGHEYW